MRALALPVLAMVLLVPVRSSAQTPVTQPPTLTIDVINLQGIKLSKPATPGFQLAYTRSGTKPTSYRLAKDAAFTGASWVSWTEGATSSSVVSGVTWLSGSIASVNPGSSGAACQPNVMKVRAYFQFRAFSRTLGRYVMSNVAADSLCVPISG